MVPSWSTMTPTGQVLHPRHTLPRIGRMHMPKSRTRAAADAPRSDKTPIDLQTQRRLRRDLKLTTKDIAKIDIELAIEAGLLTRPKPR